MDSQTLLLREKVLTHADYLAATIAHSKNRISDIEYGFQSNLGALPTEGSKKLLQARRIVTALERRLDEITSILNETGQSGVHNAFRLTQCAIRVPNDAIHALITEAPLPDINPLTARKDLESLLGSIHLHERKRAN